MPVSEYNKELFLDACNKIVQNGNSQNGIGTLKEKTLHAVLKNFYEPDTTHQEIRVGRFVADIKKDNEIIEIQTRSFNNMRKNLHNFWNFTM